MCVCGRWLGEEVSFVDMFAFSKGVYNAKISSLKPVTYETITHPETVTVTLRTPTKMSMCVWETVSELETYLNCCCHVPFWRGHDAGSLLVTQSTRSWKGMRISACRTCSEFRMLENIRFNMLNSLYLPYTHCENELNATLLSCSAFHCIYVWNKYLIFLKIKYFKRWSQDWLILKSSHILI